VLDYLDTYNEIPRAAGYVRALVDEEIIGGYNDRTFRPNNNISRSELAVMIVKAMDLTPMSNDTTFADNADIPTWARGYVARAAEQGIVSGTKVGQSTYYKPASFATRAEVCVKVDKMMKLK
jgi:hypothetical protein